jgi:hypothetical protein
MPVELLFISGMTRISDRAQGAKIGREGGRAVGCTLKTQFLVILEDMYPMMMELPDSDSPCISLISDMYQENFKLLIVFFMMTCSDARRHISQLYLETSFSFHVNARKEELLLLEYEIFGSPLHHVLAESA